MYEDFYHFTGVPFQLTLDNNLFFQHRSYDEVKTSIGYALDGAEGIIVITGKPGTGKTIIINDLLSELATSRLVLARLESTQLGAKDLLQKVASSFGVDTEVESRAMILQHMQQVLLKHGRAGPKALLIIDEAQALSSEALQEIYKLTKLRINAQVLLQVFLVGQEQLWNVVHRPDMEQFHQRLIAACHLEPLAVGEFETYVKHRFCAVGWKDDSAINGDALSLIYEFSRGVPRQINILCDRLLFDSFIIKRHKLNASDVRRAIKERHEQGLTLSEERVGSESGSVQAKPSTGTVFENLNLRSVKPGLNESKLKREVLRNLQLSVGPIDEPVKITESPVRGGLASTRAFTKALSLLRHTPKQKVYGLWRSLVWPEGPQPNRPNQGARVSLNRAYSYKKVKSRKRRQQVTARRITSA